MAMRLSRTLVCVIGLGDVHYRRFWQIEAECLLRTGRPRTSVRETIAVRVTVRFNRPCRPESGHSGAIFRG